MKPNNNRIILINSEAQTITESTDNSLPSLQKAVGGYIEPAAQLTNKDVLFVDEEGLNKTQTTGFYFRGHLFVGNGVVARTGATEAKSTIEEIQTQITFTTVRRK